MTIAKQIIKVTNRNGKIVNQIEVTSKYAAKKQAQRMIDKYDNSMRVYVEPVELNDEC